MPSLSELHPSISSSNHELTAMVHESFYVSSKDYRKFRPPYPEKLFRYLAGSCRRRETAWDVACGNGQAARGVASHFKLVHATDASAGQLQNAFLSNNIHYALSREQYPKLKKRSVDLVCVAQAFHCLNLDVFHRELLRVLKKYGVYACWLYRIPLINPKVDDLVRDFQRELLVVPGIENRRPLEQDFRRMAFPLKETVTPGFEIRVQWSFTQFLGYLRTWSIYRRYYGQLEKDPLDERVESLSGAWKAHHKDTTVVFPIDMKMGILT